MASDADGRAADVPAPSSVADARTDASREPVDGVRTLLDTAVDVSDTDPVTGRELVLRARIAARAAADPAGEAAALYHLATLSRASAGPDTFTLAAEAADLALAGDDRATAARAEHLLAVAHLGAGNHAEALGHGERALELSRAADGGGRGEDHLLNTVAAIHHAAGDDELAVETYEAALRAGEPFGNHRLAAIINGNIARIRAAGAAHPDAVAYGRRAVELAGQHAPDLASNLLADLGEAYAGLADHDRAAVCFDEARRIWDLLGQAGEPPPPANRLGVMLAEARVTLQRDAPGEATRVLRAALEVARRAELPEFEAEVDDLLATSYRRIGRFEEALDARERHAARARELADRSAEIRLGALRREHEVAGSRQRAEIFRLRDGRRDDGHDTGPQVDHAAAVQLDAFERLAVLAEFRDVDTGEHTRRVGDMAAEIAHAAGQLPEWCERLRLAGRLHDIGKVAVPDAVLLKSGPLTVDEFEVMKTHTTVGHQILVGSSSPLFQLAAELALAHHEWWDGNGYPHGRSGRDIPLSGRIVALADVFDALCSERPYKRAWSMSEAARFVVSGGGGQFDPDLVESFVAVLLARHPELAPTLA